jgi:antitoxin ParD1/3/4
MPTKHDDAMTSINVSLPDSLRTFVEERSGKGGYGSLSEYIRELIRRDKKDAAKEKLDSLLLQGIHSGHPIETSAEHWKAKRAKLKGRGAAHVHK